MYSLNITEANFEATVDSNETLIVRFVMGEGSTTDDRVLVSLLPQVVLADVSVEQEPRLAAMFGLEKEAALTIFRQRIILYFKKGDHDTERVSYMMQQISMLDMDRVRQDIEVEKAKKALHMRRACPTIRAKMI